MVATTAAIIAGAALATTAYSMQQQEKAEDRAVEQQRQAANEQRKSRATAQAGNAAQAAAEKRRQLREERVKRARILQGSVNSGTTGSSGELGAVGNLATQMGDAVGMNLGALDRGANISRYEQDAATFLGNAQNEMQGANQWGQLAGLGMSIAGMASGGIGKEAPQGTTENMTPVPGYTPRGPLVPK